MYAKLNLEQFQMTKNITFRSTELKTPTSQLVTTLSDNQSPQIKTKPCDLSFFCLKKRHWSTQHKYIWQTQIWQMYFIIRDKTCVFSYSQLVCCQWPNKLVLRPLGSMCVTVYPAQENQNQIWSIEFLWYISPIFSEAYKLDLSVCLWQGLSHK